jgi:hypothetical protein
MFMCRKECIEGCTPCTCAGSDLTLRWFWLSLRWFWLALRWFWLTLIWFWLTLRWFWYILRWFWLTLWCCSVCTWFLFPLSSSTGTRFNAGRLTTSGAPQQMVGRLCPHAHFLGKSLPWTKGDSSGQPICVCMCVYTCACVWARACVCACVFICRTTSLLYGLWSHLLESLQKSVWLFCYSFNPQWIGCPHSTSNTAPAIIKQKPSRKQKTQPLEEGRRTLLGPSLLTLVHPKP